MTTPTNLPSGALAMRLLMALPLLASCSTSPPPRFMHQMHREAYAIGEGDFPRLQFYVSNRVIAHDLSAQGPGSVILMNRETPGLAVASGSNWIRVRFQPGGEGVVFLVNPAARGDTGYTLATEVDGGSGYRLVRDVPDRILQVGDRRYRIVEGAEAYLLVDRDDLEKLVERRRHVTGQERQP